MVAVSRRGNRRVIRGIDFFFEVGEESVASSGVLSRKVRKEWGE